MLASVKTHPYVSLFWSGVVPVETQLLSRKRQTLTDLQQMWACPLHHFLVKVCPKEKNKTHKDLLPVKKKHQYLPFHR